MANDKYAEQYTIEQIQAAAKVADLICEHGMAFDAVVIDKPDDDERIYQGKLKAWVSGRAFERDVTLIRSLLMTLTQGEEPADLIAALHKVANDALKVVDLDLDGYFEWCRHHAAYLKPSEIIENHMEFELCESFLNLLGIEGKAAISELEQTLHGLPELIEQTVAERQGGIHLPSSMVLEALDKVADSPHGELARKLASDYVKQYMANLSDFEQAYNGAVEYSEAKQGWQMLDDLPPQERSYVVIKAACDHAMADLAQMDEQFASRMREGAAELARNAGVDGKGFHEERPAEAIAPDHPESFDAALEDAEARAAKESQPKNEGKARAEAR